MPSSGGVALSLVASSLLMLQFLNEGRAADMICPPMPAEMTKVTRDVNVDVKASAGRLGKLSAAEVATKTDVTAKAIFEKYPGLDKLVTLQLLAATYCSALNTSGISTKERLDRWERFMERYLELRKEVSPASAKPPAAAKPPAFGKSSAASRAPIPGEVFGEFGSYWNSGSPTWEMLKSKAGDGRNARIIAWTERCFYCEAEREISTKCWPSIQAAVQNGWPRGFIGYSPAQGAWCKSPSWATRIQPNTEKFWLD